MRTNRRIISKLALLVFAGTSLHFAPAHAAPYTHPKGWYTIDLPKGFKAKNVDETFAKFETKGGDGSFQVIVMPAVNALEVVSTIPVVTFQKLFPNATLEGDPQELVIDGRPARWMVYRGTFEYNGQTTPMVGLGGALSLPKCGVVLVAPMTTEHRAKWGETIATAFKSIRSAGAGDTATGSPDKTPASGPAATASPASTPTSNTGSAATNTSAATAAKTTGSDSSTFTHPAGSFDLPPGWKIGTPTGDLTFAAFTGPHGATLTFVIGPRGFETKKSMNAKVQHGILRGAPTFKTMPPGPYEVKSQGNNKVTLARYQGPFTIQGTEMDGRGLTAWGKAGRGYIMGIGIAIGLTAAADVEDMEKIVKTLR
jgi:hypothetical protein